MDTRNKSKCQVQLSDWRLLVKIIFLKPTPLFLNCNVLEEYEHHQRQIEAFSTKLEVDRQKLRRHKAEIDDLKASEV
ncbi:hypothetical protein PanWU01x14_223930 [Parasponia andersonii]|uniref:Uncharacterized protein n=1 Tax=Parasponia andersonii TaxID=3476 RepID=A0A2P5BNC6_PARAD|nr:hypothetical protein PanWU01x14_223930 [Parasponia andersonii]